MSRAKLRSLGLDLPVLPTSTVGSFPKPDYLVEARAKATRNAITRPELDRLERQATEFWVRTQEELGLDVLVDGEQYRGDMVAYFAETMPGFARGGLVRSYGNRYYHKPVMVGPVRWPGPMTVDWWRWTQSLTTPTGRPPVSRSPARSGRKSRHCSRPACGSSKSTSPPSRCGRTSSASPSRQCTSWSTGSRRITWCMPASGHSRPSTRAFS